MVASDFSTQARLRRTFAIISHPDAGKTTLTEHMLLAAGAIHLAGEVRARGQTRRARSDWMKIERERGISVSASVMTFEHQGVVFNLLDTPGHEDFSEDTYRTLTAADSAVMVLDAAKGVEPQTLKLFEVCRLRDIPITTFINKIDREARDSFELFDEIQEKLALDVTPVMWPAGSGQRFSGMLDLRNNDFLFYDRQQDENKPGFPARRASLSDPVVREALPEDILQELEENADLARGALPEFDQNSYLEGHLTPVYFGSALRDFGVRDFLDDLARFAPPPGEIRVERGGEPDTISPQDKSVSGFVFKVQANMDPQHHDRVAFLRLCSGAFKRGMKLKTTSGRGLSLHNPVSFFAQSRETVENAYAGDIMGIPNHGTLKVGDSLSESGKIRFSGLPHFAPEILRSTRPKDPMRTKHLRKALQSLAEEGVTQVFRPFMGSEWIVGAVGALQIEVMIERIQAEYGVEAIFETSPYAMARWIAADDKKILEDFINKNKSALAEDGDGDPVFLTKNAWNLDYIQNKFPDIRFLKTKERRL